MPGYVIHLAVAEEYLRKHSQKKENYNQFINGTIFPDSVTDKSKTHYGDGSSNSNLYKFLLDRDMKTSFNRGYFLHLLSDYLFYNKYIECFSKKIYDDYDLLNKKLIDKYKVTLPEEVKNKVFYKDYGELTILSESLVEKFVDEISNMDIYNIAEEVKINPKKWTKIRKLKYI